MARDASQRLMRVVEALDPQPGDRVLIGCGDLGDKRFDRVFAVHVRELATDEGLAWARALLTPGGVISLFDQMAPGSDEIVRKDHR